MAMYDAPTIALAPENPCSADLKSRFLSVSWNFEAHVFKLDYVAEVPIHVRRNSFDCQRSIGLLRTGPIESCPDLVPAMLTSSARDAKERDVGVASP